MNQMYMRFPGGQKKAFTISYDDNVTQDERLIGLMEKYQIKGTFNIIPNWFSAEDAVFPESSTYINVTEKKALEIYDNELVEVANHGANHRKMTCFPVVDMLQELTDCRRKLETMYQRIVTGFAYPYGLYNEELIGVLERTGIEYSRTVNSTHHFGVPQNWLVLNPTCHHADPELETLTKNFLTTPDSKIEEPYFFYVWGHTFEFDEQDNWDVIERLFEQVSGKDEEIWYATNGEVCRYHKAYKSLVFSADMTRVHNPSAIDLWFQLDQKIYEIKAGETISLV